MTVVTATAGPRPPAWNAGAYSNKALTGDGFYFMEIAQPSFGVVCGITSNPFGELYNAIEHGFIFTQGVYKVIEMGDEKTAGAMFSSGDTFFIVRKGMTVYYMVGIYGNVYSHADFDNPTPGNVVYVSSSPSSGGVVLDASLYAENDAILEAGMSNLLYTVDGSGNMIPKVLPEFDTRGSVYGEMQLEGVSSAGPYAAVKLRMALRGWCGTKPVNVVSGSMAIAGLCGEGDYGEMKGVIRLDGEASVGLAKLSIAFGRLPRLQGWSSGRKANGVRGEMIIVGKASELPYGEMSGVLCPLSGEARGYTVKNNYALLVVPSLESGSGVNALVIEQPDGEIVANGVVVHRDFLTGRCIKFDGTTDFIEVIIRDYYTKAHLMVAFPSITGVWTADVIPGTYDITYRAPGYKPINHGPYYVI